MLLSHACNYGLRAALFLAAQEEKKFISIKEISQQLDISFHFLTKVLQVLTQAKIMVSFRGPNGGIALARSANTIYLMDIIIKIDGERMFQKCLLGLEECSDSFPCPLHANWALIRDDIKKIFKSTTLADMADMMKKNGFRITN